MASYKCNMQDKCDFEVKHSNREELVKIIELHAVNSHNMKTPLPPNIMAEVNQQIKK